MHIANENPPNVELLHRVVCEDLDLSGVELAEKAEFERDPMDAAERLFYRRIVFQAPYLYYPEQSFSTSKLRELVPRDELPPPIVDADYLHRINRFFFDTLDEEFGRNS